LYVSTATVENFVVLAARLPLEKFVDRIVVISFQKPAKHFVCPVGVPDKRQATQMQGVTTMKKILSCAIVAVLLTVSSASAKDAFLSGSKLTKIGYQVPAEVGRFVNDENDPPPMPRSNIQKNNSKAHPHAKGHAHAGHHSGCTNPCCKSCTRYRRLHNIHPCAVKKVVSVIDPCFDPRSCCKPKCVKVAICVPPCGCVKVRVSHDGRRVKYDYGKYEVRITSRHGKITVDYKD